MNDAQIKAKLKSKIPGKYNVDRGLYFRVSDEGTGFWILRYTINKKRREFSFARYGRSPEGISLAEAKSKAAHIRAGVKEGIDPIAERKRDNNSEYKTVNDIAEDWLQECTKRLENPQIPERVYCKDIAPSIGELAIERVTPVDIQSIIRKINDSNRPTISNDALTYCKQLFNHAIKLGLLTYNPAAAFSPRDAGGTEKSRDRALSLDEIKIIFQVFSDNSHIFTRENYIAIAMLLIFGVRKGELIAAKWEEFDFENRIWNLPKERTKTSVGITIPLPEEALQWFSELSARASSSEYIFPSRRASRRRGYISDDTLNHALAKLFGMKVDSKKKPYPNLLGMAGIEHFVVHDLRRTCRSLLAYSGVSSHIAERCLNHKIKGVEGIYDRYDYLDERRAALEQLTRLVAPFVESAEKNIVKIMV